jgi:hypothetical protein
MFESDTKTVYRKTLGLIGVTSSPNQGCRGYEGGELEADGRCSENVDLTRLPTVRTIFVPS